MGGVPFWGPEMNDPVTILGPYEASLILGNSHVCYSADLLCVLCLCASLFCFCHNSQQTFNYTPPPFCVAGLTTQDMESLKWHPPDYIRHEGMGGNATNETELFGTCHGLLFQN